MVRLYRVFSKKKCVEQLMRVAPLKSIILVLKMEFSLKKKSVSDKMRGSFFKIHD